MMPSASPAAGTQQSTMERMPHTRLATAPGGRYSFDVQGKRSGEKPVSTRGMQHYEDYSSHNEWGTDHFGFTYDGDLKTLCEELRSKGATFAVEPWEFSPGTLLCYVAAPDGVSIELVQKKN